MDLGMLLRRVALALVTGTVVALGEAAVAQPFQNPFDNPFDTPSRSAPQPSPGISGRAAPRPAPRGAEDAGTPQLRPGARNPFAPPTTRPPLPTGRRSPGPTRRGAADQNDERAPPSGADENPFRDDAEQPADGGNTRLPARTPGRDDVTSPQPGQLFGGDSPARSEMESRIVELYQADKFAEVIPLLETVVKEAREEFMGWYLLGVSYRMVGRYDDAIRALGQATKYALTQAEFGEAHLRRGIAWYYKGEPRVAIGDFDEAASAAVNDARPEYWKGLIMASEGRYRDAITAYSNALRLSQGYNAARNNRGLAYLAMNDLDFAITDFNEVIRRSPDDASAYYKRAIALGRRGDFQDAVESYNNAIRLNPQFAAAYYNRGLVYQRLGNSQQAQADMAKARQINPRVGAAPRSARVASR